MPDINVEGQKRGSDFVKAEDYMDLNVVAVAGNFAYIETDVALFLVPANREQDQKIGHLNIDDADFLHCTDHFHEQTKMLLKRK